MAAADYAVSTHSRPKAAGDKIPSFVQGKVFQHTAARRRLVGRDAIDALIELFQHTAARRRLEHRLS